MPSELNTTRRRAIAVNFTLITLALALLGLLASCDIGLVEGFKVINQSDHRIEIVYLNPAAGEDGEETLEWISAGKTSSAAFNDCSAHPIIARTEDGTEIARREPPICVGDTWVIEQP